MLNSLFNKKVKSRFLSGKKYFLLLILFFSFYKFSTAQILCIYCYDQNDSISDNVNNLILNGGFENNNCVPGWQNESFCPNSIIYLCDITDWICTEGGPFTYANIVDISFSIIPNGTYAAYFGNNTGHACSTVYNDTLCLNDSGCSMICIPQGYPSSDPGW